MKKKGFTLIELLAVIIILAIIALIATPIILNVIDDARKSAGLSESEIIKTFDNIKGAWYNDRSDFFSYDNSWLSRGGYCENSDNAGVFFFSRSASLIVNYGSSRAVLS